MRDVEAGTKADVVKGSIGYQNVCGYTWRMADPNSDQKLDLHLTVLGRTLEHLGTQMYKRRDVAIAELVANAWDAGAKNLKLIIPEGDYDPSQSHIEVIDDGCGMTAAAVQNAFLVIERNRRIDLSTDTRRSVMGKKGIGKLAGFGMARTMEITTWVSGEATYFVLDLDKLKADDGQTKQMPIAGQSITRPEWCKTPTGTRIILRNLKHSTPPDFDKLVESLARRFSAKIRGEMAILVNGKAVGDPNLEIETRYPEDGQITEELSDGNKS